MFGLRNLRRGLSLCRFYSKPRPTPAPIKQDSQQSSQLPEWQKREKAHRKRYGNWNPTKRLSRAQMQDLRSLKQQMPHMKTIDFANLFKVLPEAIRRILQSKWTPTEEEEARLAARAQSAKNKSAQRRQQQIDNLKQAHLRMQPVTGIVEDARTSAIRPRNPRQRKPRQHQGQKTQQTQHDHDSHQPYVPSVGDVLE